MSTPTQAPTPPARKSSAVPSALALLQYRAIDPNLPAAIVHEATRREDRAYRYAMAGLITGGFVALSLIAGFVYLAMHDHATAAGGLLAGGGLSMVAGFRLTRLDSAERE